VNSSLAKEADIKRQRYPLLDLVRYIAALLVATLHWSLESGGAYSSVYKIPILGNLIRNGAIGVPIFFIISGYVILETAWRKNAFDFIVARFTRLFPGLLICMALVLVVGSKYVAHYATPFKSYVNSIFLTYTLTHTAPLASQLWTLVVEVKFYLAIALLLLILDKRFRSVPLLVAIITCWQLVMVIAPETLTKHLSLGTADYLFGLGVSISLFLKSRGNRRNQYSTGILVIYFSYYVLKDYTSDRTLFIFLTLTIVAIGVSSISTFLKLPSRLFELLGLASYLIYLLHEQLGIAFINEMRIHVTGNVYLLFLSDIIFLTILSILISTLLEKRLQRLIKRWAARIPRKFPTSVQQLRPVRK
jgi:peptidoglycan/LPS O-acetylase OafA/YrhL